MFATHRDLEAAVDGGSFRANLFFRIGAVEIALPPLRERLEDLPLLVERFRSLAASDRAPPGEPKTRGRANRGAPSIGPRG